MTGWFHRKAPETSIAVGSDAASAARPAGARPQTIGPPAPGVSSFPAELTSFVGRAGDLWAVRELLADHRLVTLTGSGGSGKTRLALELVKGLQGEGEVKAWLVDLAAVADPTLVAQVTASSVGASQPASGSPAAALVEHLGQGAGLVVLDNCEQLIGAVAELVVTVLGHCQAVKFLLTSREPAHVPGEVTWRLEPLAVPGDGLAPDDLLQVESVALFVERAQLAAPGFGIDETNAQPIAEVCRRLDGLPLALELAAARVGMLSPSQIVAKLDDRFSLLGAGGRLAPARQQTLRATLEWSYELLPERERCLFRRLSIFTGTFNLDAAEAVCAAEPLDRVVVLDLLGRLIDKSLVAVTGQVHGEVRYRMLDTMRAYAGELVRRDPDAGTIAERHARLYAGIALEASERLTGADATDRIDRVVQEIDNLRAALLWAVHNDRLLALSMCSSLAEHWDFHGWLEEGRHWLELALDDPGAGASRERAAALVAAGMLAYRQGDFASAKQMCEAALEAARRTGDRALMARCLAWLGDVLLIQLDRERATARFQESLDLYRAEGDLLSVARGLSRLGSIYHWNSEFETAERLYQESLVGFRQLDDRVGVAGQLYMIATVRAAAQKFQSARTYHQEALALRRELGDEIGIAWSEKGLAYVEIQVGDIGAAVGPIAASLKALDAAGDVRGLSIALDVAGGTLLVGGLPAAAVRVMAAAAAMRAAAAIPQVPWVAPVVDPWMAQAQSEAGPEQAEREELLGRSMIGQAAVRFALEQLGSVAQRLGARSPLTRRERQIAELVADGLTNRDIAERLHISERTADNHVKHVIAKHGFRSRAEVANRYARDSA